MSDDADADREEYQHHRDIGHEIQAAIEAVAAAHLGEGKAVIKARLQDELRHRGHWPQPAPWVEAVTEELQMGHVYRMGDDGPPT